MIGPIFLVAGSALLVFSAHRQGKLEAQGVPIHDRTSLLLGYGAALALLYLAWRAW